MLDGHTTADTLNTMSSTNPADRPATSSQRMLNPMAESIPAPDANCGVRTQGLTPYPMPPGKAVVDTLCQSGLIAAETIMMWAQ